MENKSIIFKTIDNTPRMLFWEIDEFFVMVGPFFLGLLLGSILVMLSGLFLKKFYIRWKKKFPRGSSRHLLYWHLPTKVLRKVGIFRRIPESHKRELLS